MLPTKPKIMLPTKPKTKSKNKYLSILPVSTSKKETRENYDRISKFYDYTEGIFEKKYIDVALNCLDLKQGEVVLEIGFGTGNALIKIADQVGQSGMVNGIDISPKMLDLAFKKVKNKSLSDRIKLTCGDAAKLPYSNNIFDAVFLSFTLELFDTPEIPEILKEVKRVLKPGGRLGIVSLSKDNEKSLFLRLYEWAHIKFPKYIDCRPIFAAHLIKKAGFYISFLKKAKIFLAPIEIVIGIKN